jgi:hypothetical protein
VQFICIADEAHVADVVLTVVIVVVVWVVDAAVAHAPLDTVRRRRGLASAITDEHIKRSNEIVRINDLLYVMRY